MNAPLLIAASLSLIATLSWIGFSLSSTILPNRRWIFYLPLAYPLGAGLYTWLLFLLAWAGLPIARSSALGLLALLLIIALYLGVRSLRKASRLEPYVAGGRGWPERMALVLAVLGLAILWAWASWTAIGRSYGTWDAAAIWSVKGHGIALEGTIFTRWGAHGLSYPLNLPLQITLHELAGTEDLPGGILTYPIYYVSLLGGIFAFWIRNRVRAEIAAAAIILIGTVPLIFEYGINGYSDLPLATYLFFGAVLAAEALHSEDQSQGILAGLFLGLAAWTRLEGTLYAVAVFLVASLAWWISGKDRSQLVAIGTGFAAISIPWLAFYRLYGAEGSASLSTWRQMVSSIVAGQFDWYNLRLLFGFTRRYIFKFSTWGVLFLFYIVLWGINWRKLIPNQENIRGNIIGTLALMSVSLGAVTMFLYIGISNVAPNFLAWMQQSLGRAMLPVIILAGAVAFLATAAWKDSGSSSKAFVVDVDATS